MPLPPDQHLWTLVKRRCTAMGQPRGNEAAFALFNRVKAADVLDLHTLTVQQAHARTQSFIEQARSNGICRVTIITGRSGEIRREFPTWAALHPGVRASVEKNGGGAFTLTLRKR